MISYGNAFLDINLSAELEISRLKFEKYTYFCLNTRPILLQSYGVFILLFAFDAFEERVACFHQFFSLNSLKNHIFLMNLFFTVFIIAE